MIYVDDFSIVGDKLEVIQYRRQSKESKVVEYDLEDFYFWIDDNGHNNVVIDYQQGGEHQQIDTVVDPVNYFESCHDQAELVQKFINQ